MKLVLIVARARRPRTLINVYTKNEYIPHTTRVALAEEAFWVTVIELSLCHKVAVLAEAHCLQFALSISRPC